MSKLFKNIEGVISSQFQVSSSGPIIKANSGVLEFVDLASAYVKARAANPVDANDIVNKSFFDNIVNKIMQGDNYSKLSMNTTTQIQLEKLDGERNYIIVNNEIISLSSIKYCDIAGGSVKTLIAADGTDSGANPAAATFYYTYLSNSQVAWAPNELRISQTPPAAGVYLGSSGDAANWRCTGALKTDSAAISVTNPWQICGKGIDFFYKQATTLNRNAGVQTYYSDPTMQINDLVVIPNTMLFIFANQRYYYPKEALVSGCITIDSTIVEIMGTITTIGADHSSCKQSFGIWYGTGGYGVHLIEHQYYYDGSGSNLQLDGGTVSQIQIFRFSI